MSIVTAFALGFGCGGAIGMAIMLAICYSALQHARRTRYNTPP